MSVRLYACGGAATNIVSELYSTLKQNSIEGLASPDIVFIDTSNSDLTESIEQAHFYHIKGSIADPADGSGKERSVNIQPVMDEVPAILHAFPPAQLNIVVHSASGGSGGVIGASLVSEIYSQQKAKQNVIVIMVGSTTCKKEITNTIRTIQTYQNLADTYEKAVNALYYENGETATMGFNDKCIRLAILKLLTYWSGSNKGLDSQDLDHFLNYDKVTDYAPTLTAVRLFVEEPVKTEENQPVASIMTLVTPGIDPHPGLLVGYHTYGAIRNDVLDTLGLRAPIHAATVHGYFAEVVTQLEKLEERAGNLARINKVNTVKIAGNKPSKGVIIL